MKQFLSDDDRIRLDQKIKDTEKRTGTQIVLAVIKRSDAYAEIPWKAFAMTTSLCGIIVIALSMMLDYWISRTDVLMAIAAVLITGALVSLVTVFVPVVARIFLPGHRAEEEVQQYAESLFLENELFMTRKRMGMLVLVSMFERKVVIVTDKGISIQVSKSDMEQVIDPMILCLRKNELYRAFEEGLNRISGLLLTGVSATENENELPDSIIEEDGE